MPSFKREIGEMPNQQSGSRHHGRQQKPGDSLKHGFASMAGGMQREAASKDGQVCGDNFKNARLETGMPAVSAAPLRYRRPGPLAWARV